MEIHSLPLTVRSSDFEPNGAIPVKFTADGENRMPQLLWGPVPGGTESLAILVEDPDAPDGPFVHCIAYGITPLTTHFDGELPAGAYFGLNGHAVAGWTPPNPPSGTHRYVFTVIALDSVVSEPGMNKQQFLTAIGQHILAIGSVIGTYGRAPAA